MQNFKKQLLAEYSSWPNPPNPIFKFSLAYETDCHFSSNWNIRLITQEIKQE